MDATKLHQGLNQEIRVTNHMEHHQMVMNPNNNNNQTATSSRQTTARAPNNGTPPALDKKTRPQEHLNCPRCNSTNTKFCYYNNYSLTQPRYICKTCRRYWTEGGSLRNVPVGGGSRRNKKSSILSNQQNPKPPSSSSSNIPSTASKMHHLPDLNPPFLFSSQQNPKSNQKDQDLNLSFSSIQEGGHGQGQFGNFSQYLQMPKLGSDNHHQDSSLELLRAGIVSRGMESNSFTQDPVLEPNFTYNHLPFQQEYKPNLGFSIDRFESRGGVHGEVQENLMNGGRMLFPFGEMKQLIPSSRTEVEDNQQSNSNNELWNGMMSGGPSWRM